jgi:hypothetical protein
MRYIVLALSLLYFSSVKSQENSFVLGVGVGGYFAFKSPAQLYNGAQSYSIPRIFSTQFFKDQIDQELVYNNGLTFDYYSENIRYTPSVSLSANAGYFFSDDAMIMLEGSFTTLRVADVFTMFVDRPNVNTPGRNVETFPITGKESRTHLDLSFRFVISEAVFGRGWFSLGVHGNFTQFKENKIQIGNLPAYDVANPVWYITNNFPQGFGWGLLSGFTQEIKISDDFALEAGVNAYWHTIKMADKSQELVNARGFSFMPHIRILWLK